MWSPREKGKWKNFFLLGQSPLPFDVFPKATAELDIKVTHAAVVGRCFHDGEGDGLRKAKSEPPAISTSRNSRHLHPRHPIILFT